MFDLYERMSIQSNRQSDRMKKVMEISHAIAEVVSKVGPKVIAAYPITPQTHIVERLSELVADGILDAEYLNVESEHSAISATMGAQATGVRAYTATASQGLALMHEILSVVAGERLPVVIHVANRTLSAPLTIWNDWSDAFPERDNGWLQFYAENGQDVVDTTIMAYKIAENHNVLLPVMINIDGFILSHVYEPIDMPSDEEVKSFVGEYKPLVKLDVDNPLTLGEYATPENFQEFKEQQWNAMMEAKNVIKSVASEFKEKFGRGHGNGLIETYNLDGAKHAIITMGSIVGTFKHFIDQGVDDIGIIKIRSFRPFPWEDILKLTEGLESVGVFEKVVSLGLGGPLAHEIKSYVKTPVMSFVGGLSGRDVTLKDVEYMFNKIRESKSGFEWIGSKLKG